MTPMMGRISAAASVEMPSDSGHQLLEMRNSAISEDAVTKEFPEKSNAEDPLECFHM